MHRFEFGFGLCVHALKISGRRVAFALSRDRVEIADRMEWSSEDWASFLAEDRSTWLQFHRQAGNEKFGPENRDHVRIVVDGVSIGRREFGGFCGFMAEVLGEEPASYFSQAAEG